MSSLWVSVERHVLVILQVGLPVTFVLLDMLLKWISGKTVFRDFGADVCRAGLALYVGTVVGLIARGRLQAQTQVLTSFLFVIVFGLVWWFCILLSYGRVPLPNKSDWQKWLAAIIGLGSTYVLAGLSWYLIADLH